MQKSIFRVYKLEEIEAMNYILGKNKGNNEFSKFELEAMSKIDLTNSNVVNICKIIWDNKDNVEKIKTFSEMLEEEV